MSDDEADPELLALLRQHLQGKLNLDEEPETGVLEGAEYVYDNSIDVALDMRATKNAAAFIYDQMQQKQYSTETWAEHELHPKTKDESTVAFIFIMDLLNFSFWSLRPEGERFAVSYRDKTWTGYWSLVASLQRALEEEAANGSAAALVNLLARDFSCFRDEFQFEGRRKPIRFLKRAQILVADIWGCFNGESYGAFRDIDKITMFADYRVPQILATLGCIGYSPPLQALISRKETLESGSKYEMQLRACSIWCVELIRREIKRHNPEATVNAILIDFFLYDTMKALEADGKESMPHHRTRSIWY
ncbi:hypothetical protein O1611_g4841 [Lasiodiplodia mahajangana]|uniref:Uncharacterized protein n=1 Tax=Lasiodiplodia mahajangana TaxID=1108764 RepID=A0ACC2JMS9_9PEZI|nr:hypothetical protein O1611_g4841 [Lasiodiplodia mahajangana]